MNAHAHTLCRYYADGGHLQTIGDTFRVGVHATCKAVHAVTRALVAVMFVDTVAWPAHVDDRTQMGVDFYTQYFMHFFYFFIYFISCFQPHQCVRACHVRTVQNKQYVIKHAANKPQLICANLPT